MQDEERLITTGFREEDGDAEQSLRPHSLGEYIGQDKLKKGLNVYMQAAIARHEPLVVRRERDERDHAGDVAHVTRRTAVDARAVGAFRADRGLDCGGRLIRFVADVRADRGLRVAALHERQRRRGAVARPRGEHFERLHDVGLAQAVGPLQDGDAGGQVEQAMIP